MNSQGVKVEPKPEATRRHLRVQVARGWAAPSGMALCWALLWLAACSTLASREPCQEPLDTISTLGDVCLSTWKFSSNLFWEYFAQRNVSIQFQPTPLIFTRASPLRRIVSAFYNQWCLSFRVTFITSNREVGSSVCVLIWVKVWVIPGAWALRRKGQLLLYLNAYSDF